MLLAVGGWASITSPTRTTQRAARRGDALLRAVPTAMVGVEDILRFSKYDQRREQASTATLQPVELPTVDGRVDGPLVQTLATVCRKLYDHSLQTVFKPVDAPVNDKLEQPYELVKAGGEYNEGGTYTANGVYTNGKGALVSGYDIFNKDTTQVVDGKTCGTASLASYGCDPTVCCAHRPAEERDFSWLAGGSSGGAIRTLSPRPIKNVPALFLSPNCKLERHAARPVPASVRGRTRSSSSPGVDLSRRWTGPTMPRSLPLSVCAVPAVHPYIYFSTTRWSTETKQTRAHGAYVNLVEDTFARHEDAIVALARLHKVKRAFFTGHSLGGGLANVAHLAVRGQLNKAGSPWAELKGKVTWLAYTFAAPQTIVRKYTPENTPRLMADLDDSSYNVVYGCDVVPRFPGMLKYLGAIVEIVAPDIVEDSLLIGPTLFGHARRRLARIAPPLRLRRSNQASIKSKATQFLTLLSVASSISLFNKFVFNKFFAIWLGLAFLVVVAVDFLKKELGKPAEAAVEFLKEKGLAEVMG
eukprot:scaffold69404_cov60-Phaeocystis_antarctica.AAC.2